MLSGVLFLIAIGCIVFIFMTYVIRDLIHYHRMDKISKEHEEDK